MRANSAEARDVAFQLHPYTNLYKHDTEGPFVVSRGKGVRIWDNAGKEYIEGMAGLWCVVLGLRRAAADRGGKGADGAAAPTTTCSIAKATNRRSISPSA